MNLENALKPNDSVLLYEFPVAAVINDHKLDGLKPKKNVFSQLWRVEVRNAGVSRAGLPLKAGGEGPSCLVQCVCWLPATLD